MKRRKKTLFTIFYKPLSSLSPFLSIMLYGYLVIAHPLLNEQTLNEFAEKLKIDYPDSQRIFAHLWSLSSKENRTETVSQPYTDAGINVYVCRITNENSNSYIVVGNTQSDEIYIDNYLKQKCTIKENPFSRVWIINCNEAFIDDLKKLPDIICRKIKDGLGTGTISPNS